MSANHAYEAQERLELAFLVWLQAAYYKAVPQWIHPTAHIRA